GRKGRNVTAKTRNMMGTEATRLTEKQWREIRGNKVAMMLQDALNSLDPLRPIHREIADALPGSRKQRKQAAFDALYSVEMPEPALRAEQRSPQLSGGM